MKNQSDYQFLSSLEKKVWDWLVKNNISFQTERVMLAEARELGSAVVDFYIPDRNLVLRVMGSYYHSSIQSKARDILGKERLLGAGYQVVDLWEENLTDEKIEKTMTLALQGQEMLR